MSGKSKEYAHELGNKLRSIRQQQNLSLHGVEQKSRGRWKAVVIGSYERGDRAITVQKLSELAEFYGVPVRELLPGNSSPVAEVGRKKLILDLEAIRGVDSEDALPLLRYTATIQAQRGDYNGRVLSIRHEDLTTLAVIYDESPATLVEKFSEWGVIAAPGD